MAYLGKLRILQDFINNVYIPDVVAVAQVYSDYFGIGAGCKNLLSYGCFDLEGKSPDYTRRNRLSKQGTAPAALKPGELDTAKIVEHVGHSWNEASSTGKHPS